MGYPSVALPCVPHMEHVRPLLPPVLAALAPIAFVTIKKIVLHAKEQIFLMLAGRRCALCGLVVPAESVRRPVGGKLYCS